MASSTQNPLKVFLADDSRLIRDRVAALLAAADKRLTDVYPTHPIGLTVEVHEIDPDMTFRRNTLRERAKAEPAGAA